MELGKPILFAATTDSKRSRKFYEETLGLEFVADEPYALVFRIGEIPLRIQKVDQKPRVNYTVLGWMVTDIRKTVQELTKAGVKFLRFKGMNRMPTPFGNHPAAQRWPGFRTRTIIYYR